VNVRPATLGDAKALAELETRVWRSAYGGLLPQALLDGLSAERTEERWNEDLREGVMAFVAEAEGRLLGFAGGGPARDPAGGLPAAGEIYGIYLDETHWGMGHGRALFERCRDELGTQGFFPLVIWVLDTNLRARRFYERQGMLLDGEEKLEHVDGHALPQVRYWLPDA
jgi:GNAT superfamily N-acetyltransferase